MSDTNYIHEAPDGRKVEYRRAPSGPGVLRLEARVLRPDGRPYPGVPVEWYPVSDGHLLDLQLDGSDIVGLLAAEQRAEGE